MFFTREDILKIQQALLQLGVKDSELPDAEPVTYDDTLSIVQEGKNKQIGVKDFFNQISLWKREDFLNITDRYDEHYISLREAINLVPILQRKDGLVITFQDVEGNWEIYQFRGNITEFLNEEKWFDLYDYRNYIVKSIVPDEEDLTASTPDKNGNSLVYLKDRVYDPKNFSGKGYKILRKNIITIKGIRKNILTYNEIKSPNTIYIIRYNFDLNNELINIPEGCILKFEGGCLNNGSINFNNTSLEAAPIQIFNNIEVSGEVNIDKSYCEWFGGGFNCDDSTKAIKQALKLKANEFIFYKGTYNVSDSLIFNYSNIIINQTATVKAIANMDYLILFDLKSVGTGGIYGVSTFNYITGGGCVDGNGLANICIALDNILHGRIYNLKIKNGRQYCLELDYKEYSVGYKYIDNLEIYNELLIKDAIGIHCNSSDGSFSNIQLIDFKYSIFAEKDSKFYYIHGWALHSNFYLDNDCEIWKESALIKLKNIPDIHLIHCENDTLRYLVTKDKEDVKYKPTLYPLYCNTINNNGVIPLTIIKQYPQETVSSKDINVNKFLSSFKFDNIIDKIFKITVDKNFVSSTNLMFFGFEDSNLNFTFSMTSNKGTTTRIYLNCLFNFITVYYDTTEDYINIYLNIKGTYIYNTFCANHVSFENIDTIPNTAINLSEKNVNNIVLYSNYFKKLEALNNFKYINTKFLTYVEDIDKFVFINNKNFKYLSLKEAMVTSGMTVNRPTVTDVGFQYFDNTLNKPIWWTGTKWIDATGVSV